MDRRTTLKLGAAGAVLGTLAAIGATVLGRDPVQDRRDVLQAVVPALLDGALPSDPDGHRAAVSRAIAGTEAALAGLAPATQSDIGKLFELLASTPGRLALARVTRPWPQASTEQVAQFLRTWRLHDTALFRVGYQALHDLVLGAWYADERNWASIGYGGPLNL